MTAYNKYSDEELSKLLKSGDEFAFTEIHHRYYGLLYSHASKRLSERHEVKDILQEIFLYLWHNREQNFTGHISGYLYTAVRNKIFNIYKHKKIKSDYMESLQDFLDHSEPIADEIIREKELIQIIEKEVANLPPKMRLIFELSRNSHLSHQEIADKLDISPQTVKKQVANSLKILRVKLGSHFHSCFL